MRLICSIALFRFKPDLRVALDPESLIRALVDEGSWLPLTPGGASSPYRYGPEVCTGMC